LASDDAELLRLLTAIGKNKSNAEVGHADSAGPGALDLDEIGPIWSASRRSALSNLLLRKRAVPASPALTPVLDALQRGNVALLIAWLAEQELAALAQARKDGGPGALQLRLEVAHLARQQGVLALAVDTQVALAAFRRALEHDGNDPWSQVAVGDLLALANDQASAAAAYQAAAALFRAQAGPGGQATATANAAVGPKGLLHAQLVCQFRRGEMLAYLEKHDEAVRAYRLAVDHAETLLALDPRRLERMFEVATAGDRLAVQLTALNKPTDALALHKRSLVLAEALAQGDADGEAQWQFYMFDKHEHIADLQLATGDAELALQSYRTGLEMGEKLITRDIGNDAWLGSLLGLIAKVGAAESMAQTGEERRQLVLHGLELLGRVRSGEIWDNSEEWGERLRQILYELPPPDGT
jgi:tetratricopeptide (TPR) repeat protein